MFYYTHIYVCRYIVVRTGGDDEGRMSAPVVRKRKHVNTQQNPLILFIWSTLRTHNGNNSVVWRWTYMNSYLSAGEANLFKI